MYDLVSKRFWFFLISGIIILIGIVAIVTPFGSLKLGTEFSGGSQLTIVFPESVSLNDIKEELNTLGYPNAIVRTATSGGEETVYLIRTQELTDVEQQDLVSGLTGKFGGSGEQGFENISAEVATETIRATAIAIVVAVVCMLIYIIWAFRSMPHPIRYGTCAVIALVHDVVISIGIFSLLAGFLDWEVDLMFITGILTIVGYSINGVVVVFDRIRENVKYGISSNFEYIVNDSVISTTSRCLNTGLTTSIALIALMLFVGATIQNFVVVLLVGVIAGAYGSICVAPMLLVVWHKKEWGRFIGKKASP